MHKVAMEMGKWAMEKAKTHGFDNLSAQDWDDLKDCMEAVERIIRIIGQRAELDRPLTPHLFRHTLATLLLQRGTPITEVQKILGHVDINTTTIYAKVSDDDVRTSHMKYAI
ncbi:Tyrosine recombinase XerD [uncultured Ruminococcus sp.]|nr:Tyrosine recombinase XerD [uncultured Ruminococcus sp.]